MGNGGSSGGADYGGADFGHPVRIEHRPAPTNAHALRHGLFDGEADGLLITAARVQTCSSRCRHTASLRNSVS